MPAQIMKIDPGEKYVLVLPDVSVSEKKRMMDSIEKALRDSDTSLIVLCGDSIALVPASQVIGYVPFKDD